MKISRRGLFGLVGAALVTPYVPLPALNLANGSQLFFREHKAAMFGAHYGIITQRKLMARIRITEECINDTSSGPFEEACRNEQWRLHEDIARRLSDSDYGV